MPDDTKPRVMGWGAQEDVTVMASLESIAEAGGHETRWSSEDPRLLEQRLEIVILRRVAPAGEESLACYANVEADHGYYIHTGFYKPYDRIGEGDDWPSGWQWVRTPFFGG